MKQEEFCGTGGTARQRPGERPLPQAPGTG
jgi:hypothetical protein